MASNTCGDRIKFSHFKEVTEDDVSSNHGSVTNEHYDLDNLYLVGYTTNGSEKATQFENVKIELNNIKSWIFDQRRFVVTTIDPITNPVQFCEQDPNYIYLFKREVKSDSDISFVPNSVYEEWIIVEKNDDNVAGGDNKSPERLGSVSVSLEDYAKKGVYRLSNLTYSNEDQQNLVNPIKLGGDGEKVISIDSVNVVIEKVVNNSGIWENAMSPFSLPTIEGIEDVYYATESETYVYFYGKGATLEDVKAKNTWYENGQQYMQYISEIVITYTYVTPSQFEELITKEANKNL